MEKILLVEDDAIIASGLVYALEQEGYKVTHAATIQSAKRAISEAIQVSDAFDLAILDMQLPDGVGFDLKDELQAIHCAIIFLTVIGDEGNIVRAFESGAADYITKPFRLRELLARIKRTLNLKEVTIDKSDTYLTWGQLSIDLAAGKVYANQAPLELTALEYRLLLVFAMNRGQQLTRGQILEQLWDTAGNFVEDNTLTVYVKRLREKLGDAVSIETIRGVGYRGD